MDAILTQSQAQVDREISALVAELLAVESMREARDITLRHFRRWFHLIQGFWLEESRLPAAGPHGSILLNALEPLEAAMMETGNVFRPHNPVLKAVLADPSRGPTRAIDVLSKHAWEHNPFRAEVVQPLGLMFAISFHISEGVMAGKNSIFTPILSRDGKDFSIDERIWMERARTFLEPIFAHIREKETKQAGCPSHTGLSMAEREVFHWLCQGKRNKEIAVILGRSHRTVEKHVEAVLKKTRSENRTVVAAFGTKRQT